jgi:hypothetical protein
MPNAFTQTAEPSEFEKSADVKIGNKSHVCFHLYTRGISVINLFLQTV